MNRGSQRKIAYWNNSKFIFKKITSLIFILVYFSNKFNKKIVKDKRVWNKNSKSKWKKENICHYFDKKSSSSCSLSEGSKSGGGGRDATPFKSCPPNPSLNLPSLTPNFSLKKPKRRRIRKRAFNQVKHFSESLHFSSISMMITIPSVVLLLLLYLYILAVVNSEVINTVKDARKSLEVQ